MNSETTRKFREAFAELPESIQERTRKTFQLWRQNHDHPSDRFKKVGVVWSARVDDSYRVLGHLTKGTVYWFWIGPHDEYERLITESQRRR
jgi:hypothetical protein